MIVKIKLLLFASALIQRIAGHLVDEPAHDMTQW